MYRYRYSTYMYIVRHTVYKCDISLYSEHLHVEDIGDHGEVGIPVYLCALIYIIIYIVQVDVHYIHVHVAVVQFQACLFSSESSSAGSNQAGKHDKLRNLER